MRRRVAIVGGGIAGLTAAYELSRTREERARWDVTVYEMGHRLGGRLASAHAPERWGRNEEHGLHVWFGFYDNTFRLAEEVWRDFPRPADCPWDTIWEGLRPIHTSDHGLRSPSGEPMLRRIFHARNGAKPGLGASPSPVALLTGLLDLGRALAQTFLSLVVDLEPTPPGAGSRVRLRPGQERWLARLDRMAVRAAERLASPRWSGSARMRLRAGQGLERTVARLHPWAFRAALALTRNDPGAVELAYLLDGVLAAIRAIASPRHGILVDGDLDRVSELEVRELLRQHGAHPQTLERSRLLESIYDIPFAYRDGDRSRPVMEASTALRYTLRIALGYKHAIAYLLTAGAAETLVAPLVALLRTRGVRFRPFHRLESVGIDRHRKRIDRLSLTRSARARGEYDPLEERDGFLSFRPEPDWSQLVDGEGLRERELDPYSRSGDPGEADEVELRYGHDFHDVVLALPLGCITPGPDGSGPVEEWLRVHPSARACLERLHLVPTVAAQLWFDQSPQRLGLEDRAVVTWTPPYSVVCDMSPVIAHERWPEPGPRSCAYLCGCWPLSAHRAPRADADAAKTRDLEEAHARLDELLDGGLGGLLHDGASCHVPWGSSARRARFVRVNVEPWDLADLPLPGADRVRLEAHDTGLCNLALAGSWVRTHVNTTSVEAAVSSGIAAARALGAQVRPIMGEALLRRPPREPTLPRRAQELSDARPPFRAQWPAPRWHAGA